MTFLAEQQPGVPWAFRSSRRTRESRRRRVWQTGRLAETRGCPHRAPVEKQAEPSAEKARPQGLSAHPAAEPNRAPQAPPASEKPAESSGKPASATFTKLRSGDWGLRVTGTVKAGDRVQTTTKAGKKEMKTVGKVMWIGDGVSLCTMYGLDHDLLGDLEQHTAYYEAVDAVAS